MSAALQLSWVWGVEEERTGPPDDRPAVARHRGDGDARGEQQDPPIQLAFYRKHTERMLRRYLHASMLVGRAPSILGDPVARGWASSRPIRSFEDAVIFVLDMEKCLDLLSPLDRTLLSRVVLQEYTQAEAAALLRMSARAVSYKLPLALDRLTEKLMEMGVLVIPEA